VDVRCDKVVSFASVGEGKPLALQRCGVLRIAFLHLPSALWRVFYCKGNLTDLRSSLYSESSQGRSEVNIYQRVDIIYNTYLAKGNLKRTL
jgi:hypothetical protein